MKTLDRLKKSALDKYIFPGTDAAVLVVNKPVPQKKLESIFSGISGDHRFYPTKKGWKIKFPYWYIEALSEALTTQGYMGLTIKDIKRQKKGWDHEHCSFCHAHIHIGDLSYTHPSKGGCVYVICPKCAKKCK